MHHNLPLGSPHGLALCLLPVPPVNAVYFLFILLIFGAFCFLRVQLCASGPFILRFSYCLIAFMFLFCEANFLLWDNKGLT